MAFARALDGGATPGNPLNHMWANVRNCDRYPPVTSDTAAQRALQNSRILQGELRGKTIIDVFIVSHVGVRHFRQRRNDCAQHALAHILRLDITVVSDALMIQVGTHHMPRTKSSWPTDS